MIMRRYLRSIWRRTAGALLVAVVAAANCGGGGCNAQTVACLNGHIYEFDPAEGMDWASAKAYASGRTKCGKQGHLVTITSPAEQLYVENLVLSTEYMGKLWIGMNSKRTNAAFKWVTGEKLKFANWDPSHSPQSVGSTCIVLDLNVAGKWRDEWCKAPAGSDQPGRYDLRFVVEYDCATTSCGALADAADVGQASDGPPCKGEDRRCWVDADCCDGFACRGDSFLYCTQD